MQTHAITLGSAIRQATSIAVFLGAIALMAGFMIWADIAETRTGAALEIADRCVAWAHEGSAAQAGAGTEIATRCNQYFNTRSDTDADDDDQRWQARHDPARADRRAAPAGLTSPVFELP